MAKPYKLPAPSTTPVEKAKRLHPWRAPFAITPKKHDHYSWLNVLPR